MSGGVVGRARLGVALGVLALAGCTPEVRFEDRGLVEHALGDDVRVQQRWRHDEHGVNGADYLLWRRQGQDWLPLVGDWQPGRSYSAPTLEPPCQRLDARRLLLTDGDASWIFDLERGTRSGPHPWAMLLPVAAVEGRPERWFAFASWKDGASRFQPEERYLRYLGVVDAEGGWVLRLPAERVMTTGIPEVRRPCALVGPGRRPGEVALLGPDDAEPIFHGDLFTGRTLLAREDGPLVAARVDPARGAVTIAPVPARWREVTPFSTKDDARWTAVTGCWWAKGEGCQALLDQHTLAPFLEAVELEPFGLDVSDEVPDFPGDRRRGLVARTAAGFQAFAVGPSRVTPLSGVTADSTDAWTEARRRLRLMNERAHDAVVEAERKEAQAALDAMIASRCASYGETREAVLELLRSGGLRVGTHSLQAPCTRCAGAGQVQDQRSTTSWTDDEGYMTIYRWSVTVDCELCHGTGWY